MKVVILCGGRGTRISEETEVLPKPMVMIGNKPILWHIMKLFSYYGHNDFILCLGYKGYVIKEYFSHYFLHMSDATIDMANNKIEIHNTASEPWKVTLVDTGLETMTGGRLKRVEKFVGKGTFLMTYGDGVANIDIDKLVKAHRKNGRLATLTAVQSIGRFGVLGIGRNDAVRNFLEKPKDESTWINGGFFALESEIFKYIKDDTSAVWEQEPLERLAADNDLDAYKHSGFWKCMDTLRDKIELERMWNSGKAEWKVWK